ncbi:MAG: hypothetical protein Q9181_007826, partial [Wetmoreana brouardii]
YVVVATDYAGLGIGKNVAGDAITHSYLACSAHANDVVYSVQAAQSAFPSLSKHFVVIGHSQGGGAAWATTQRQVLKPISGFLGAVAVSPVTDVFGEPEPFRSIPVTALLPGIVYESPDIDLSAILTPDGRQRLETIQRLGPGVACALALLSDGNLLRPESDWMHSPEIQAYREMVVNGGKEISGPLLVIHGDSDPRLTAESTCDSRKRGHESLETALHRDFHAQPETEGKSVRRIVYHNNQRISDDCCRYDSKDYKPLRTADLNGKATQYGGLGYHFADITPPQKIIRLLKTSAFALAKLSVLVQLHRIFKTVAFRRFAVFLGAIVIGWWIASVLAYAFICTPVRSNWTRNILQRCGNLKVLNWTYAIPWIVTDFAIWAAPLPMIHKLQLSRSNKIGLCALFLTGGVTCIVACVRFSKVLELDDDVT